MRVQQKTNIDTPPKHETVRVKHMHLNQNKIIGEARSHVFLKLFSLRVFF